jgi:hypothetical protein
MYRSLGDKAQEVTSRFSRDIRRLAAILIREVAATTRALSRLYS